MATMVLAANEIESTVQQPLVRRPAGTAERNRRLYEEQLWRRRGPTPEMFFTKRIDNSRLMKEDDPIRRRQVISLAALFLLVGALTMIYVGQHVSAISMGYRVEAEKQQLEQLREANRRLRLNEAELTDPGRIDRLAREMGMKATVPGQLIGATAPTGTVVAQAHAPRLGGN